MTDKEIREIRAKALKDDSVSINNRLHHAFNQGFELGRKSATPKKKTAAWVPTDEEPHEVYECNACGWLLYYEDRTDFKYCPNCGARMVSE